MSIYDEYAFKCYERLNKRIDPLSPLELPQLILNHIAIVSIGHLCSKAPPLSFRYVELIAHVLAVGHRMGWTHCHSDYFLDEKIPQTDAGFSVQWSFLTTDLLHSLRKDSDISVLNNQYSTLLNSILAVSSHYSDGRDILDCLKYIGAKK